MASTASNDVMSVWHNDALCSRSLLAHCFPGKETAGMCPEIAGCSHDPLDKVISLSVWTYCTSVNPQPPLKHTYSRPPASCCCASLLLCHIFFRKRLALVARRKEIYGEGIYLVRGEACQQRASERASSGSSPVCPVRRYALLLRVLSRCHSAPVFSPASSHG